MNRSPDMLGNIFTFENPRCDCQVSSRLDKNGVRYDFLNLKRIKESYKYAYAPIEGLVMIDQKSGEIIKNKIVDDFLSVDLLNLESIKNFIDNYGFIMMLPDDGEYKEFSHRDTILIMLRFQKLVELISSIYASDIDYDYVLKLIVFLLFCSKTQLYSTEDDQQLHSYPHIFTYFWYNIDKITQSSPIEDLFPNYNDYFNVSDTFTSKLEQVDAGDYFARVLDPLSNAPSTLPFYAKIMYLYVNAFDNRKDSIGARYVIDFFYHLLELDINIKNISTSGKLFISGKLSACKKFDDHFKSKFIFITKNIIKEEIDFMLYGVHPTYNIESMSPDWQIDNLFTALYFSIFYTKPDYEIYRQCANPNCKCFFKVKTTNSKKIYHDYNCQNAAAQMRHRKSKKKKIDTITHSSNPEHSSL